MNFLERINLKKQKKDILKRLAALPADHLDLALDTLERLIGAAEVRGQRSEVRGQGPGPTLLWPWVRGEGSRVRGQGSGVRGKIKSSPSMIRA